MTAPTLRFKEFVGDWEQIKISDYSETVTSGSRDWAQYYSDSGEKFIRMTNLVRDGIYLDLSELRFVKLPQDSNDGKRTSLKFGDILISITAELGKLGWVHDGLGTAYINQHTALVRMNENVDSKYIAYNLSTEKYNNKLNSLNDSGAKAGLNLGTLRNFELTIPNKIEQTKIASFLSAVDEKISQLNQKHRLLCQYKQGMMQKLFSQQLRFKADDGSEFGEWEEKKLGEISSKVGSGSTPRGGTEAYTDKGIIFIRSQNVNNNQLLLEDVVFIPKETHKKMSGSKVSANDILLNITGASIGRSCTVPSDFIEANVNQHVCIIRTPKDNPKFIQAFLSSKAGQDLIESYQTGSGREGLNFQSIRAFELNLPCLEEQTKIANFLSAIDQKIEVVAEQIEQAKTWKKGLLQQMFL